MIPRLGYSWLVNKFWIPLWSMLFLEGRILISARRNRRWWMLAGKYSIVFALLVMGHWERVHLQGQESYWRRRWLDRRRVQAHPDYVIKTFLRGLTGNIRKESYAGIMMAPMGNNTDEWIASVASFIRANFENESSLVTAADVARVRKETASQTTLYTFDALWASIPKVLVSNQNWKMTASNTAEVRKGSTASPLGALTFEGWTTGVTQQKGMWFQVELPQPSTVSEIQFKSPPISRGWREGSPPPIHTYPRGYDLEVSTDGQQWTKIITNGEGTGANNTIRFKPVQTKFLRITLTKSESIVHGERRGQPFDFEVAWTMREFKVLGFGG